MTTASNKFKLLVESGKWMAPSDVQAKIIALEAKVNRFENKGKSSNTSSSGGGKSGSQKSGSGKSPKKSGSKKKDFPAWMTQWPGKAFVDANKSKQVEGRTYWWCRVHKRFCMHQTNQCKLAKSKGNNSSDKASTSGGSPPPSSSPTPSIRVSTATMMDE